MEVVGGVPGDAEVTALLVHRPVPILKSDGDRDLGLLDVVRTRCGPDLVDARKLTPDFFERVFRLATMTVIIATSAMVLAREALSL